ncbi:LysR family transcriptional regulator [Brevibacillus migulae]|uniref:LysR family transcriptional regulator n=1 Tax=Brevibacillus migulae TaxID=1644114 RepID=UPI00106EE379|nr:LysR family transcriptional regulator [Brevibacillus migulae]
MTFLQLKVLVKVIETGSFTKTGQLLNLSQSGVSHTIAALERELGKKLLIRDNGKIRLTETGESLIGNMKEILYQEALLLQKIEDQAQSEKKLVKMGTFPSATYWLAKCILPDLKKRSLNVEVSLMEGTYVEIEEWIKQEKVDLGITTAPLGKPYEFQHLFHDPLLVAVSEHNPLANKESLTLEELASQPFIMPIAGCQVLIRQAFKEAEITPAIIMELRETQSILQLVEENIGVTILPKLALRESGRYQVRHLVPGLQREIGIAVSPSKKRKQEVQAIVDLLHIHVHQGTAHTMVPLT